MRLTEGWPLSTVPVPSELRRVLRAQRFHTLVTCAHVACITTTFCSLSSSFALLNISSIEKRGRVGEMATNTVVNKIYEASSKLAKYPFEPYWPEKKLKICVTGAGGFIARYLIAFWFSFFPRCDFCRFVMPRQRRFSDGTGNDVTTSWQTTTFLQHICSHLAKRLKSEGHYIIGCDWKRNEHMPVGANVLTKINAMWSNAAWPFIFLRLYKFRNHQS